MSERLNTQDLVDLIVNRQGLDKKEAESFTKEFFLLIEEGLERDKTVKIKGLGTFKLVDVESRESVNVNTGERIEIQGHTKISFTPDSTLRDVINKPFAHFETVVLNDGVLDESMEKEEKEEEIPQVAPEITEEKEDIPETIEEIQADPVSEVVETPQEATAPVKTKKDSSNNKILIVVIILTTLICGILLFFTYYSDIFPPKKKQPIISQPIETEHAVDSTAAIVKDSVEAEIVQIPASEKLKVEKNASKPTASNLSKGSTIPFSQIPVNPDSTSYEIIGTKTQHTIREGQSLIRISYRYYGTKDLWPYLVMHNRSIIKNPNAVPFGTTINIPELKKK